MNKRDEKVQELLNALDDGRVVDRVEVKQMLQLAYDAGREAGIKYGTSKLIKIGELYFAGYYEPGSTNIQVCCEPHRAVIFAWQEDTTGYVAEDYGDIAERIFDIRDAFGANVEVSIVTHKQ